MWQEDEARRQLREQRRSWEKENGRRTASEIRRRASSGVRYYRRRILRISKARAARICGVSRETVARWEDPESSSLPDVGHLGTLTAVIGGDVMHFVWVLFGREEIKDGH